VKISTDRFGEVEVPADALVTFPDGLPGIDAKRFALVPDPQAARVQWLQALGDPSAAWMTVRPDELGVPFDPHFKPGETLGLKAERHEDLECRVIAWTDAQGALWLNLFAPLLIHRAVGLAMQLPLVGSGYSPKQPWPDPSPSDNVLGP